MQEKYLFKITYRISCFCVNFVSSLMHSFKTFRFFFMRESQNTTLGPKQYIIKYVTFAPADLQDLHSFCLQPKHGGFYHPTNAFNGFQCFLLCICVCGVSVYKISKKKKKTQGNQSPSFLAVKLRWQDVSCSVYQSALKTRELKVSRVGITGARCVLVERFSFPHST